MKTRLVLLGPPASGKGTQAELLSKALGIPTTSTGAILRHEKSEGTKRGALADEFTRDGRLVPDTLIYELVDEWLHNATKGFLFDGFPRTVPQGEWLEAHLDERGLDRVILLEVPAETIRDRVLNRLVCSSCGTTTTVGEGHRQCPVCGAALIKRRDDTEESLAHRLKEYEERTAPLIPFYEKRNLLVRVDANRKAEDVQAEILKKLVED